MADDIKGKLNNINSDNVMKKFKKSDSICWNCKRNCGGCSWSRDFKPVTDWTATKKTYRVISNKRYPPIIYDSYTVTNCPYYIQDNECRFLITERDEDGIFSVMYAMADRSVKDYLVWKRWCIKKNVAATINHEKLLNLLDNSNYSTSTKKMISDMHIAFIGAINFFKYDPYAIFGGMTVERIVEAIEAKKKHRDEVNEKRNKRRAESDRQSGKSKVLSK